MQIIERKITELKPYANNPRLNDGAVDAVAASIKAFGFKVPIVIDADGVIVAGHTRLKAAQKLGLKTVPCIVADDLTPEQIKAFRLADNKVGELAGWDFEKLDLELEELDFDMTPFGFDEVGEASANDIDGGAKSPPMILMMESLNAHAPAAALNSTNDCIFMEVVSKGLEAR